ncbi:hypothetical protein D3C81_1137490 [compost metagenome]
MPWSTAACPTRAITALYQAMVELGLMTSSASPCSRIRRPPRARNAEISGLVASVSADTACTRAVQLPGVAGSNVSASKPASRATKYFTHWSPVTYMLASAVVAGLPGTGRVPRSREVNGPATSAPSSRL